MAKVVATHDQESMCTVRAPLIRAKEVTDGTRPLSAVMVEHSMGRYGVQPEQWQRLDVRAADLRGRPRAEPITVGDGARSVPLVPLVQAPSENGNQPAATADSDTDAAAAPT